MAQAGEGQLQIFASAKKKKRFLLSEPYDGSKEDDKIVKIVRCTLSEPF